MIAFLAILNFTPISRKSLNYLNVGIEIKIVLNLCGLFLPPLFSSLDNSFHSLTAMGLGGAKIQFSDFFWLSTSILFTFLLVYTLGAVEG